MALEGSELRRDIFKPPSHTGQLTPAHGTLLSSTFCKDIFKARIHTPLKLGKNNILQGHVTWVSRVVSRFQLPGRSHHSHVMAVETETQRENVACSHSRKHLVLSLLYPSHGGLS